MSKQEIKKFKKLQHESWMNYYSNLGRQEMMKEIVEASKYLIRYFEGFRSKAYLDVLHPSDPTKNIYSIGYGRRAHPDEITDRLKEEDWLTEYVNSLLQQILDNLKDGQRTTSMVKMLPVLVSFTFNCGLGNMKQLCKEGRGVKEILETLPKYNKSGGKINPGLVARRNKERTIALDAINSSWLYRQYQDVDSLWS